MKLTIVAATGGIGRHLLEQAVAAGHTVTALVRNPDALGARVRTVTADLAAPDPQALRSAVHGADAVLSGLGPRGSAEYGIASRGTRAVVEAMKVTDVRRIVVISVPASRRSPSPAARIRPGATREWASSCAPCSVRSPGRGSAGTTRTSR